MSQRLYEIIAKIMEGPHRSGTGVVSEILRPGEIRLEGRTERVLVAGNALPRVGQAIPWLSAGKDLLIASYNLRRRYPALQEGRPGRAWEEVEVSYDRYNSGVLFTHRDSTGRYWVKAYRSTPAWYSQEAKDFATSPWTFRLSSYCAPAQRSSHLGLGDTMLEVGSFFRPGIYAFAVRTLLIDPDSGEMSEGDFVSLPDAPPDGWPWYSDICQDSAGRYHIAASWDHPYLTDPERWREWCWMSAPGDAGSWSNTFSGEYGRDVSWWSRPRLFALGDAVIKFGHVIDPDGSNRHVYRVCQDGAWGSEEAAPFDGSAVWGVSAGEAIHLVHPRTVPSGGGLEYRTVRLGRGGLVFSDPTLLMDTPYFVYTGAMQPNQETDMPAAAIWTTWLTAQNDYAFRRFGLPPEDAEEEIPTPFPEHLPLGEWATGGGDTSAGRDGFIGYYRNSRIYAARIVEA